MTNSYSAPITYNQQVPLTYFDNPVDEKGNTISQKSRKPSSILAGMAGAGVGAIGGLIAGFKKNPYIQNGQPTDTFAKASYEKYVKKVPEAGKDAYLQGKTVLKKINKIRTADELRTLLTENQLAAQEICTPLNQTSEEFMNNINEKNLSANKKVIKEKLQVADKTRFQNMKNNILACWDAEKRRFSRPENMDKKLYRSITGVKNKIKSKLIGKFVAIGALATGTIAFLAHKIYVHKKSSSQQQY